MSEKEIIEKQKVEITALREAVNGLIEMSLDNYAEHFWEYAASIEHLRESDTHKITTYIQRHYSCHNCEKRGCELSSDKLETNKCYNSDEMTATWKLDTKSPKKMYSVDRS